VRGDLAETDAPHLLHRLHRAGFSGGLRFRHDDAEKTLWFDAGVPVYATSNLTHDRLGDLLFREGKINRQQFEHSRQIMVDSGRRMGAVLCELQVLKPQELFPTLRRQLEEILYSLFAWTEAAFEPLDEATQPPDRKLRIAAHPDAIVVEGIRRKFGLARLLARLGGEDAVLHPLSADLCAALCDVALDPPERRTLGLFDGQRSLGAVIRDGALDAIGVCQLAYALEALELARFDAPARRDDTGAPPVDDAAIERARIVSKLAVAAEGDYFAVLGVSRDASDHEVRRAYEAALREYAPESFRPELAASCAPELATILQVLHEAYAVLGVRGLRESYAAHLGTP
jgi:hypothetical protein